MTRTFLMTLFFSSTPFFVLLNAIAALFILLENLIIIVDFNLEEEECLKED